MAGGRGGLQAMKRSERMCRLASAHAHSSHSDKGWRRVGRGGGGLQVMKRSEQMYRLIAMCISLCPQRAVEDSILQYLQARLSS